MNVAKPRLRTVPSGDLKRRIEALGPWFHNMDLGGVWTAPDHFLGDYPAQKFERFADRLPADLSGKSVIDIGCNAGFYSLEMKRRGAGRMLGIDSDERYLAQARLASETLGFDDIEFRKVDVYDVAVIGERFDLVIFMGVLYHLRHPLLALDLIHEHLASDLLLFQSMHRGSDHVLPLAENYPFEERELFFETGFPKLHFVEQQYAGDLNLGGYRPNDVRVVVAWDVDKRKVGRGVAEAIFAPPNCTTIFHQEVPPSGTMVRMGRILDGIADHMVDFADDRTFLPADEPQPDQDEVVQALRDMRADVLISYLPVGSQQATEFYAECALQAGGAMVNSIPVFIASDEGWARRFEEAGVPIIGDDIKSQLGATIVHRVLTDLFKKRGVKLNRTYQLNTGGNTDFLNMLSRSRLKSKKISKTEAVQSVAEHRLDPEDIHVGPSDYVPWQNGAPDLDRPGNSATWLLRGYRRKIGKCDIGKSDRSLAGWELQPHGRGRRSCPVATARSLPS